MGTPEFAVPALVALAEAPRHLRHEAVRSALARHLDGQAAHDDVSLLLVDCPAVSAHVSERADGT